MTLADVTAKWDAELHPASEAGTLWADIRADLAAVATESNETIANLRATLAASWESGRLGYARAIDAEARLKAMERDYTLGPHPYYGPCDALAPGNNCAECVNLATRIRPMVEALRFYATEWHDRNEGDLLPTPALLGDAGHKADATLTAALTDDLAALLERERAKDAVVTAARRIMIEMGEGGSRGRALDLLPSRSVRALEDALRALNAKPTEAKP